VRGWIRQFTAAALLLGTAVTGLAAEGIYTCVDAKGRKLTSDRTISDCIDREQFELNPSGTVRRKVGPSLTAVEQAALEAQQRQVALERARQLDEKRRNHALLIRYPTRAVHDSERNEALSQVDGVIRAAQKRIVELQKQRQDIDAELEFYKNNPTKTPGRLKRQSEENGLSIVAQGRFITEQEEEKKRINARFDEELIRLQVLWSMSAADPVDTPRAVSKTASH